MELEQFCVDLVEPAIAVVTFGRPPVNAQNRRSREELVWLADSLSERDDVRVVILTGSGHCFSAGADIKERRTLAEAPGDYLRHNRLTRESFFAFTDCTKPVIAAINGPMIGAGYALAAGCDILITAASAYLQMPELDRGLLGGAKFLEQHLPRSVARMLFFTGRKMSADDLLRYGVVVDVVDDELLMDTALQFAREIAAKNPIAVSTAKTAFNITELMPHRDGYRYEQSLTYGLASSEYAVQAQQDFLDRRRAETL